MGTIDYTATCQTEGCPSNGVDVPMELESDLLDSFAGVVCGACGQPISDVKGLTL